jgi:DNA-binding NarL/FixJ family response regulator
MFSEDAFRSLATESLSMLQRLQTFRRLFKTDGGHLTSAGKAVIPEALKAGLSTGEIASLLDVAPAVVRYHIRALHAGERPLHVVEEREAA